MGVREIRRLIANAGGFDWDRGNIRKSWIKHKVTNKESEEMLFNEPLVIFEDKNHSGKEKRYGAFGTTNRERYLTIVFTFRNKKIRIISVRDQSKKERRCYGQKIKTYTQVQK